MRFLYFRSEVMLGMLLGAVGTLFSVERAAACNLAPFGAETFYPPRDASVPRDTVPVIVLRGGHKPVAGALRNAAGEEVPSSQRMLWNDWTRHLLVFTPNAPLPDGRYTLSYGVAASTFMVAGGAPAQLPEPVVGFVWRSLLTGKPLSNYCDRTTGAEEHIVELTLAPSHEGGSLVWIETVVTDRDGKVLATHGFRRMSPNRDPATGPFERYFATEPAACIEVTAIDLRGQRSTPLRKCRPDQCVNQDIAAALSDAVPWPEVLPCDGTRTPLSTLLNLPPDSQTGPPDAATGEAGAPSDGGVRPQVEVPSGGGACQIGASGSHGGANATGALAAVALARLLFFRRRDPQGSDT